MSSFCVVEQDSRENHAGSKARNDAAGILQEHGFRAIVVHHSEQKGIIDKLGMSFATLADWGRICRTVGQGDMLLIQYPLAMYPRVSRLAVPFVRRLKRKQVRVVLLVHDIESLRDLHFKSERQFFDAADEVIVHNQRMLGYLLDKGYRFRHCYILGLFDYLVPEFDPTEERNRNEIAIAGNLRPDKCGFTECLEDIPGNLSFHLYGPNYAGRQKSAKLQYKGEYTPEELPGILHEGWGLVWDGDSVSECRGASGKYLRFNSPHKLSLYLASGMPVIVWDQAAVAEYVAQNRIGIVISGLQELSDKIKGLTAGEYEELRDNAERLGGRLRKGASLGNVICQLNKNGKKDAPEK